MSSGGPQHDPALCDGEKVDATRWLAFGHTLKSHSRLKKRMVSGWPRPCVFVTAAGLTLLSTCLGNHLGEISIVACGHQK